jgi:hypothetical protein
MVVSHRKTKNSPLVDSVEKLPVPWLVVSLEFAVFNAEAVTPEREMPHGDLLLFLVLALIASFRVRDRVRGSGVGAESVSRSPRGAGRGVGSGLRGRGASPRGARREWW